MAVSKLPSGRWRATVYDRSLGRAIPVSQLLGDRYRSFDTKSEARRASLKAQGMLGSCDREVTVAEFRERWTTESVFLLTRDGRPLKESSVIYRLEKTKSFVDRHGGLPMVAVGDEIVAGWVASRLGRGHVPALRAMWNAAMSPRAGRLLDRNPWAGLGLAQSAGRKNQQPPSVQLAGRLIAAAREHCSPAFAGWLQFACWTGMRPGEIDALRWRNVDLENGRVHVVEQFQPKSGVFDLPKNGECRVALLTPRAREAVLSQPQDGEFVFVNARGSHFRPSTRSVYWGRVRSATGFDGELYLATRHFAGSYMTNELGLRSEDVAIVLGHTDGGTLVRRLYGHRDRKDALTRAAEAYTVAEEALVESTQSASLGETKL